MPLDYPINQCDRIISYRHTTYESPQSTRSLRAGQMNCNGPCKPRRKIQMKVQTEEEQKTNKTYTPLHNGTRDEITRHRMEEGAQYDASAKVFLGC